MNVGRVHNKMDGCWWELQIADRSKEGQDVAANTYIYQDLTVFMLNITEYLSFQHVSFRLSM